MTVNGKTEKAVGWLQTEWEIDPAGGANTGGRTDAEYVKNKPPTHHARHRCARQASGDRSRLTATVTDDGLPKPRRTRQAGRRTGNAADASGRHRRAGQRAGGRRARRARNAAWRDAGGSGARPQGPSVSWIVWRGPADADFSPRLAEPKDGKARHDRDLHQAGRVRAARRSATDTLKIVQPGRQGARCNETGVPCPGCSCSLASGLSLTRHRLGRARRVARRDASPGPREPRRRTVRFNSAEDGYTSSDTCRACHPSQYATWHALVSPHDDAGGDARDRPRGLRRRARWTRCTAGRCA